MATRKLLLAFCLLLVVGGEAFSQKYWETTNTTRDSAKIAAKNRAQFADFQTNSYPYPARPRDMWELGLGVGVATMSGDLKNDPGFGYTLTARKSLSHVFSLRPYYSFYSIKGNADINQIAISQYPEARDYKTRAWGVGFDALASLNTIRTYRGNPKFNIYLLAGIGVTFNQVKKDYNFDGNYVNWYNYPTYNTLGNLADKVNDKGKKFIVPTFNVGGGLAWKLNNRFNVAVESKNMLTNYDYLDGFSATFSNAFDSYWFSCLRLNYNIGDKAKRMEPLWWVNPNNFVYDELNEPKHLGKAVKKMPFPDADGDGVDDRVDLEPNTPAGVNVDAHGRAIDTDGDGVPDYKDKELLTRQECFPVNADGAGTCPPSQCCKDREIEIIRLQQTIDSIRSGQLKVGGIGGGSCGLENLPSIVFKSGASLNRDNMKLLDAVATQMSNNPGCKLKVIGHPEADKKSQQKAYDRVEGIIKYLVEKRGISESRFIFNYDSGSTGDSNTIDLQGTTEEGPNTVSPPAPHLKGKN